MNAPTEDRDESLPSSVKLSEAESVPGSERESENAADLRSRLLRLILESEQKRKSQASSTSTSR